MCSFNETVSVERPALNCESGGHDTVSVARPPSNCECDGTPKTTISISIERPANSCDSDGTPKPIKIQGITRHVEDCLNPECNTSFLNPEYQTTCKAAAQTMGRIEKAQEGHHARLLAGEKVSCCDIRKTLERIPRAVSKDAGVKEVESAADGTSDGMSEGAADGAASDTTANGTVSQEAETQSA